MLSLYPVLVSAFFVPGSESRERLLGALLYIALAGCVCCLSGLLYSRPSPANPQGESLVSTLPVRMFLWAMAGMAALFLLSWFLVEYFAPLLRHDCCRP
jgi:hypothetical protein